MLKESTSFSESDVLTELIERERLLRDLVDPAFPEQTAFVEDDSPLLAGFCTRRAGKTMGVTKKFIRSELIYPGNKMLYCSQSLETAKGQLKDDCMDEELDRLKIRHTYNKSEARYRFTNSGGSLKLIGMDANEKQRKKALGQKYKLANIDEAQDYEIDLTKLVFQILKPAMADLRGQIVLSGTPADKVQGLFYDVTTSAAVGWKIHQWTTFDNPHMLNQWQQEIEDFRQMFPNLEELSWFKQQYLGQWVIDLEKLVYKYNQAINRIEALPEFDPKAPWYQVLGVDLGWEDASSFTLHAYRDYDRDSYITESWKKSQMLLYDVEKELKRYKKEYPNLSHIVIDNASKQAVKELEFRTGLSLIPAEKAGKYDFIQMVNSDLKAGHLKIVAPKSQQLITELQTLVWDERALEKGVHKERSSCQNHCCDGGLYTHRFIYSYIDRGIRPQEKTLEERMAEDEREEGRQAEQEHEKEFWERDYGE